MPRKKKGKTKRRKSTTSVESTVSTTSTTEKNNDTSTKKTTRRRRRTSKKKIDVDSMAKSIYKEIITALALDYLDLDEKLQIEIAKEVISLISSMSQSYSSRSAILHRASRLKEKLGPVISSVILANKKELREEELEYVIYHGGRAILPYLSDLYDLCKRLGRDDLISLLRELWEKEGHPLPVRCPFCGFASVTPSFECIICGRVIDEVTVKEQIGFTDLFELFLEIADVEELKKVSEDKAIAYNPKYGLKPATRGTTEGYEYILPLDEDEIYKLKLKLLAKSLS